MTSIRDILDALASGKMTVEEAERELQLASFAEVANIGMLDVNRHERSGVPEVVFAEKKTLEHLSKIVSIMIEKNEVALLTRVSQEKLEGLMKDMKDLTFDVTGSEDHLTVLIHSKKWIEQPVNGKIAIMTAGTSDITYAYEAKAIARLMGVEVLTFFDVGVAGIHRLVEPIKRIIDEDVDAVVVFAGMEGALPTVVASLIDIPVIGVPVPTGYGFGGKGETALASMLQSCAPGLAVVNIGNGLGGGSVASLIAKRIAKRKIKN
ncbi:MAG: nickel pincer cofactor biosynthesis protein LarB [Candidatus Thorarchaeota archaeon]